MDRTPFTAAVSRIRAEQFFQEKAASAPAVSAVEFAYQAREALDEDLMKAAELSGAADPVALYEKLGGKFKTTA